MDKKETKRHVSIGIIGHVDQGKTALTQAILKTLNGEKLTAEEHGGNPEINTSIRINIVDCSDNTKRPIRDDFTKKHCINHSEPDEDQM